jgi:hypothetical protein
MYDELFEKSKGVRIDFGCGESKSEGWIGVDRRKVKGVDIVQDLQLTPWPDIPSDICITGVLCHVYEHIEPKYRLEVMDEIWRVMKVGGQLFISAPYATSMGAFQDPTHYPCPNEATFQYFDPKFPLYNVYKVKPWILKRNSWQLNGNIEVILEKQNEVTDGAVVSKT